MIDLLTSVPTRITRTVSALVAIGILFVVVALLPDLADQFQQLQALTSNDGSESAVPSLVNERLQEQFQQASAELERRQAMMIAAEDLPSIQNELLMSARESGCQISRAAIQSGYAEIWTPGKGHIDMEVQAEAAPGLEEKTSYDLQTEHILLNLSGTFEQIGKFALQIREKPWLCKFLQLNVSRLPDESGRLSMEATVAFIRLKRKEKEEFIDWRSAPPKNSVQ